MQKDQLISLANKMCKELLSIIDEEEEATKEQVASYLTESAQLIMNLSEEDMTSAGFAETMFHNAYKDIAKKSLSSYANTNQNIEKLARMQEKTLMECHAQHIDLPSLTTKFNEIQNHMSDEVKKANEIITQLTTQVKTLEEKSNLDSLTKVFNRRALSTYLKNVCSNDKLHYEFHMLILDIDDFKNINDRYGHVAGDKVLIFIANILKKTLRDGDKVFRYGGEEFIIILNRIDDEHCKKITNRLLDLVRGNKLIYKGEGLRVTMSIGTTRYAEGDTPDSLVARADKALYKAKNSGKNQMYAEMK
ncbi:diguanylate cyclase (GGDEF domain) [Sulfurimonas gotlandica GD1]|uniref:diguanylate cyclase n=1 Tax=Sulfurimonas gotlandica (strain DSM 19862 / JCM 16533 / GD1) TaxID=929558 RepID=B6BP28_SULGG|nr:GGDEF domain-containing protein [Sulfurimonas gotlandica]EDZ61132.1 diguanylate cyclase [Sulfurimonas gotlandica GD1]EHP30918.1 diguanylate cyclase (GGDEF domain) [Sulfurimonas gotlandica GD1]